MSFFNGYYIARRPTLTRTYGARSEAHDSGLCAADPATRCRFATDLLNLTLSGTRVNRYDKVDRDAGEWLLPRNRCWFAARLIAVRQRYNQPLTDVRRTRWNQALASCTSTELITFARGEVPAAAPSSVLGPRSRGDRRVGRQPERPRQLRGSSSARTPVTRDHPAYPVHAGRRRRRRRMLVWQQSALVPDKSVGIAARVRNRVRAVPQLHDALA